MRMKEIRFVNFERGEKIYVSVWLISEIKVFVREILLSNFGM